MNYFEKILKKTGWISMIESIVFAILGIILVWYPEGTVKTVSYILGSIFILVGVYKVLAYFFTSKQYDIYHYDLVYGLMAIVIGLVTIIYSNTIGAIFRIMIGIWITYSSFMRMNLSIALKKENLRIWISSFVIAILMLVCGLYIILNPGAVVTTIGIMMIISSVLDVIQDVIFMKNMKAIF